MKKKLQVFVSSTYEDMKEERQKAVEAILAAGHIPAGMELFAAESERQWTVIKRWIRESDVFLILLGGRYGSIEPTSGKSYIHREFEYASSLNKPIMSIIISQGYLDEKMGKGFYSSRLPVEVADSRYLELKGKLREKMSAEYANADQISTAIARMFANNVRQFEKCSGWVSGKEFQKSERVWVEQFSGVYKASTGLNRDEEFRMIRDRAQKEIFIVGAGMSQLSRLASHSLESQLQKVPIHLYMLDPRYLEEHPDISDLLENFFNIPKFTQHVRMSFDALKNFCESRNNSGEYEHRISLSIYRSVPTMSMVMIDPDSRSGELVVEYFSYQCGEERPLFAIKKQRKTQMFHSLYAQANNLFKTAEEVVK